MNEKKRVLVAYGSKHGATAGLAEHIGAVIREAGHEVEVLAAGEVEDIGRYHAVILGSGVYIGRWLKEASRFLKRHETALAGIPTWLFSSGPTGEGQPEKIIGDWRFPSDLKETADRVKPRDIKLFHGLIDPKKLSLLERQAVKMVKAAIGDHRDWEMIATWAKEIAAEL